MKCPVCPDSTLAMTHRETIEIDYCPSCRGVWLDRGELDKLIERAAGQREAEPRPELRSDPRAAPQPSHRPYDHDDDDYRKRQHGEHGGHYGKRRRGFLGDLFDFD